MEVAITLHSGVFLYILRGFSLPPACHAAKPIFTVAEPVFATLDPERTSVHQCVCQFSAGGIINLLGCSPSDLHPLATLFLGQAFFVDQPDRLIFIHGQDDRFCMMAYFP